MVASPLQELVHAPQLSRYGGSDLGRLRKQVGAISSGSFGCVAIVAGVSPYRGLVGGLIAVEGGLPPFMIGEDCCGGRSIMCRANAGRRGSGRFHFLIFPCSRSE